jgi:hypothetical protein
MGKAARGKREQREAPPLPARFDFGPQFLIRTTAGEGGGSANEDPLFPDVKDASGFSYHDPLYDPWADEVWQEDE